VLAVARQPAVALLPVALLPVAGLPVGVPVPVPVAVVTGAVLAGPVLPGPVPVAGLRRVGRAGLVEVPGGRLRGVPFTGWGCPFRPGVASWWLPSWPGSGCPFSGPFTGPGSRAAPTPTPSGVMAGKPPGGVRAREDSSSWTRSWRCCWARRRSAARVRSTRVPSAQVRRLDWPKIRSRSIEGTSVILSPAAATRQFSTVSISKPSPQSMPSEGAVRLGSGRSRVGRMSIQKAL
jgi:hypothetical protein